MGASVGEIDLDLRVNQSGFNRQLKGIQAMAKNVGAAIASAFAVRVVINFGKTCISTATEVENAWVGLNSIINGQGKSFNNAKKFIQEYISDGLVPLKNAVIAYKNLSLRGYNEEQIQKVMNALKNSATYARQSQYSLGDAISTATEGLKNENSIVVDNAGVTKNVAKMWEDYAKSIGVSYTSLTKEQKIQAEVNAILEETKFQMGDAEKYANTYSGKVAKLSASFTNLKVKIGNILKVIAGAFIPVINNAIKVVEKFIDGITALLNSFGIQTNIVDTLKDVSETAEGSSNNIDGITESAKEAEKAVNRLMGFDEINLLSKDDSSANSDNTNSGDGSVDMSGIADETKETSTVFDGLINKVKKINELLSPTKTALQGLSSELKRLSDFAFDGLKDFYNSFLKPVAVWTIGKGLPRFIDAITNGLAKVNWQKINDSLHALWVSLAPFAINIGEGLLWFWENVLVPLGTWTLNNAVPAFLDLLSGAIDVLNPLLEVFMELGKWLLESFLIPIASWTGGIIISALEGLAGALKEIGEWMSNNKSIVEGITVAILAFFGAWAVGKIAEFISISGGLCGALVNIAASLGNTTIAQGLFNIAQGIGTTLVTAWNGVCAIASVITRAFSTTILGLNVSLGVIILAIGAAIAVGVLLYKNWDTVKEKASELWENIKNVFDKIKDKIKSVCDSIKGFFKGMINSVIGVINKLINGINKISIDVPDWDILPDGIQGKSFSPKIPQIPMLAEGGFVKANTPQLAMIGDNKYQGEIVAPEDKLQEMANNAAKNGVSNSSIDRIIALLEMIANGASSGQKIEIKVGERQIGEVAIKGINKVNREAGKNLITTF